jgi:hypothetical protein
LIQRAIGNDHLKGCKALNVFDLLCLCSRNYRDKSRLSFQYRGLYNVLYTEDVAAYDQVGLSLLGLCDIVPFTGEDLEVELSGCHGKSVNT